MANDVKNIMIVGVGGQGTLLASKLMGKVFIRQGLDVKVSEVHGMSQRGGSVVTYVRCGSKVYSPVIAQGEADIIIAFEQLEAARWLPYLKRGGILITNTQCIDPMPVISGTAQYPPDVLQNLEEKCGKVIAINALEHAKKAGSARAVNVVLLGAAARHLGLDREIWMDVIESTVPQKFLDINKQAFTLGYGR